MKIVKALLCIFISFSFSQNLFAQDDVTHERIRGTNTNYEADDWTSYTMTRMVSSITIGQECVYFGTTGGIIRYNFYTHKWDRPLTISDGLADNYVYAVAYDLNTDYLWCSTRSTISVYRTNFKRWENFFYDEIGIPAHDRFLSIGYSDGYVWFETKGGNIYRSDNQQGFFDEMTIEDVPFRDITWFGRKGSNLSNLPNLYMQGGYFFDQKGIIKDSRLNDYPVTCYYKDRWNMVWVGSWGAGVASADARIELLELMPNGFFIENVSAAKMDNDGNIWGGGIGSYNEQSGISFWDRYNDTWIYYQARFNNSIRSDQVTSISIDYPYVWFGTEYGLACYNRDKDDWRTFYTAHGLGDNYVYDVESDSDNVWIATANGLSLLVKSELKNKEFQIHDVVPKDIRQMKVYDAELMYNLLWVGTDYGLYVYDTEADSGGFENAANGPQNNRVTAIGVYEDKEVWCGMPDGVEVFNLDTQEWQGGPQKRFLTSNYVNYIVVDSSAAWLATNNGVQKFDKKQNRWVQFTVQDGLMSNEVNCIFLDGDYVWFGTPAGLTRFYWNAPYRID